MHKKNGGNVIDGDVLDGDVLDGDVLDGDVLDGDVLDGARSPLPSCPASFRGAPSSVVFSTFM
jgi:hypothetical protein